MLGLPPDRFWDITLRLALLEIDAAEARLRRDREMVWWGAMLPHLKERPTLEKFAGYPIDNAERIRRTHAAWDKIDAALARNGL